MQSGASLLNWLRSQTRRETQYRTRAQTPRRRFSILVSEGTAKGAAAQRTVEAMLSSARLRDPHGRADAPVQPALAIATAQQGYRCRTAVQAIGNAQERALPSL